jgi:hypothetical protein
MRPTKQIVGWNEYVDLPEWGIHKLRAKMDTGARSSAVHVAHIQVLSKGRVCFWVAADNKRKGKKKKVVTKIKRRSSVRASIGHETERIFVVTKVKIGSIQKNIEVSLVDREKMIFNLLLGRTAIRDHFLVDPKQNCLLRKKARKK